MTMHTTGLTQEQINKLMKGIPTYYDIGFKQTRICYVNRNICHFNHCTHLI